MLKSMRKNMKAIMWVLLVTFVLWGGSSAVLSRSRSANYAGIAAGKKVGWKEYERNLNAVENQAKLMYGEKFNEVRHYLNLEGQAWDRILLLREAAKRHVSTSDNEVIETICQMPLFQDAARKFVPQIYKRVVEYFLRVSARDFEDQMKDSIKIAKLQQAVVAGVTITDNELKEVYKEKNEKVNVDYVLVSADDYKTQVSADEQKINEYYQKYLREFKTPLRVNIEYISFEYDAYQKSQDKAADAASDVSYELMQQKQPDFAAVAKKFGLPIKETGFFAMNENIPGIGLSYQVAFEAFRMEPGQISPPIKAERGRYIIKVKAKKEPYIPVLDEIRQKVKDAVVLEEAKNLAAKKAEELLSNIKQKMASGSAFKQACDDLKLEIKSTGLFTKAGYVPEIGQSEEFAAVAFSSEKDKLAGIAEVPQGAAIIFVADKAGIDEKKFDAEKEQFKITALQEKQQKYFEGWFKKLKEKANVKVSVGTKIKTQEAQSQQPHPASLPLDDF